MQVLYLVYFVVNKRKSAETPRVTLKASYDVSIEILRTLINL